MRYVTFLAVFALLPVWADAQHSPSLPSIGLPLPAIGLRPVPWEQPRTPAWERQQLPPWERNRIPPWEAGYVPAPVEPNDHRRNDHRRGFRGPQVVYVPYVVPVQQSPQVIVVQQPPAQIITVEVPVRETRVEAEPVPRALEPPYVPSGDRTVYVIPGCYVGNIPPKDVKLPAACDLKKVTTFNP